MVKSCLFELRVEFMGIDVVLSIERGLINYFSNHTVLSRLDSSNTELGRADMSKVGRAILATK